MDLGVAASAVAAAGLKLLSYNRSNFFENLKLQQSRKFRRQQIIAAQANLFRSDVQQVIGASVTVQERLTIVSTLMLVAATYSFGVGLPNESADFLQGLVYLTLSNSSLYFLLALFSCISASILARTSQKVLLNNCVRPPFEEMIAAVDESESKESAEHFERQGVSALLRIPGSHFLEERFGRELLRLRSLRSGFEDVEEVGSLSLNRLLQRQRSNDEAMSRLQLLWDDLATYAPYYLSWGVRNLLLAYAFRSMGFYYRTRDFDVFLQTCLWIVVSVALGVLTNMVMPSSWTQSVLEHLLVLVGIGLSLMDARFSTFSEKVWWKREGLNNEISSITAAFVCQLGLLVSAHVRFYINTKGGPMLQTFREIGSHSFRQDFHSHAEVSSGSDSASETSDCEISDFLQGHIKRQSRLRDGVRTTCLLANVAMILIWFAVCCGEAEIWRQLPRAVKATEKILDNLPTVPTISPPNATQGVASDSPFRLLAQQSTGGHGVDPMLLALTTPRGRVVVKYPGDSTVREILESQGLHLAFFDRLVQRRLVVRNREVQVNHDVPLAALSQPPELVIEIEDSWR